MTLADFKRELQFHITEMKCEVFAGGWDKSIPVDNVKKWIKKVEKRVLERIKDEE